MSVARESILTLLEETDGISELYDGELREKPQMSFGHNDTLDVLLDQVKSQLSRNLHRVRYNSAHLTVPNGNSYIPDLVIVPVSAFEDFLSNLRRFERYADPMPFVVEIWSPSTGSYAVDRKIPGYQARGDLEIWRIRPFDRTVQIWRRQAKGGYAESLHLQGIVTLHALPQVRIDLEPLFVSE